MRILKEKLMKNLLVIIFSFFLLSISFVINAKDIIINGNKFSDEIVIISIIGNLPETNVQDTSNFILKKLNNS